MMINNKLFKLGYTNLKLLVSYEQLKLLNSKITEELNNPSSLMKASNLKKKNINKLLEFSAIKKKPLINLKNFYLTKKDYEKGFKFFSKRTNSVQIKDPLLKFEELNNVIFSDKIYSILKNYFGDDNFYFLYGAIRLHFDNDLPDVDYNFYHLDKTYNTSARSKQIIKYSIPLTLGKRKKIIDCSEFSIITKKIKHISGDLIDKIDYSKKKNLPYHLKKKIHQPKIKSGDCLFFDPVNFFHNASKPKKLRIVFYGVAGRKSNYIAKKTKLIKISSKIPNQFNKKIKKFISLLRKV